MLYPPAQMPESDELEGITEVAPNLVPTLDQEDPVATYQDWNTEDTQVITCRIANDLYVGKRYESVGMAQAGTIAQHGKILEANYVPGRAFFRVAKVTP